MKKILAMLKNAARPNKKFFTIVLYDLATVLIFYFLLASWSLILQSMAQGIAQPPTLALTAGGAQQMEQYQQATIMFLIKSFIVTVGAFLLGVMAYSVSRTLIAGTILQKTVKKIQVIKSLIVSLIIFSVLAGITLATLTGLANKSQMTMLAGAALIAVITIIMIVINYAINTNIILTSEIGKAIKQLSAKKIIKFMLVASVIIILVTIVTLPMMLLPKTVQLGISALVWIYLFAVFKIYFTEIIKQK